MLATAESHHQQEVIVIVIVDEQFIPGLAVQNIPLKFTVLDFNQFSTSMCALSLKKPFSYVLYFSQVDLKCNNKYKPAVNYNFKQKFEF